MLQNVYYHVFQFLLNCNVLLKTIRCQGGLSMSTKIVTAMSSEKDELKAVEQVMKEAYDKLGDNKISLTILYTTAHYNYETVLHAVREKTGKAPLIGCTSAANFNEISVNNVGIAVSFISSDTHKFFTSYAENLQADPETCLAKAVSELPKSVEGYPYLSAILVHDGLVGRGEEAVLSTIIALGPNVSFAGGSAADDLSFKETFIFVDDKVSHNSAGLCLIASKKPVSIGMKHGHQPFSEKMSTSRVEENVLYEIDGKPAWDVWKEEIRDRAKALNLDVDEISDTDASKLLVRYELGLSTGKDYKIRVPLSKNEDGSLNFACTIPTGASFKIMESPIDAQIESAHTAAVKSMQNFSGKLAGALIFDCVCRGLILEDRFYEAVEQIKEVLGPVPILGFETYGEICKEKGQFSGYHNTSTVIMLIPD